MQLAELNALVAAGLASGEVKPLPVTVYPRTEVEEAFRYLASGELPTLASTTFRCRNVLSICWHFSHK